MLSSPDGASSYPQKTTTRDAVPLPDAARRIIRNQRGGGSPGMARHVQTLQKENLMPVRPSRRAINPQVARAHGSLGSSHRAPTLQEMYNTWRALEEQIDKMRRLPMFIKAERKFCHACRILKIRVRVVMMIHTKMCKCAVTYHTKETPISLTKSPLRSVSALTTLSWKRLIWRRTRSLNIRPSTNCHLKMTMQAATTTRRSSLILHDHPALPPRTAPAKPPLLVADRGQTGCNGHRLRRVHQWYGT